MTTEAHDSETARADLGTVGQAMTNAEGNGTAGVQEKPRPKMDMSPDAQRDRDIALSNTNQLEIEALVHEAVLRTVQKKRGILFVFGAGDLMVLKSMIQALDHIPGPTPPAP